jgi:5'-3' exonuclease
MSLPTVYLVDASIYIFRAWFSISDEFANNRGEPTNAVYGFTGFLCSMLEQSKADHIAVAFDESLVESYRNEIYPQYKANRDPAPEELKRQFAWARGIAESMGLSCFADDRYEADDLIGTLASHWRERGHPICVVSSDKDLAQLIGANDVWWDFTKNLKLGPNKIKEKFGVFPEQIADYLALTGDAVDNIPGVPGVGPKSAVALLNHFGDLDEMWLRLDEIPHLSVRGAKSLHKKLRDNRESADIARKLTIIETAVPSALANPAISRNEIDEARLNRLFDDLAFGQMLRRRCLLTSN